jgi:hypothetical protein
MEKTKAEYPDEFNHIRWYATHTFLYVLRRLLFDDKCLGNTTGLTAQLLSRLEV